MTELILFGTGDFAQVVFEYLAEDPDFEVAAFTVDRQYMPGDRLLERPVVAFEEVTASYPPRAYRMLVAIGYSDLNRVRRERVNLAKEKGYQLVSYVCKSSHVPRSVSIGENCIVLDENSFQPFSVLGDDTIVWSNNVIGHHARIGSHCCITSGVIIGGQARIGDHCFLGFGSGIRDQVTVGHSCVIGAGALVMRDAAPEGVYKGNRAERSQTSSAQLESL